MESNEKCADSQENKHKRQRKLSLDDSSLCCDDDSLKQPTVSSKKRPKTGKGRHDPELEAW